MSDSNRDRGKVNQKINDGENGEFTAKFAVLYGCTLHGHVRAVIKVFPIFILWKSLPSEEGGGSYQRTYEIKNFGGGSSIHQ